MRNTPALLALVVAAAALAGCKPAAQESVAAPAAVEAPVAETAAAPAPVATADVAAPATSDSLARFDGYGDMKLGSTVDEAKTAWAGELKEGVPSAGSTCHYLSPKSASTPSEFGFMMEDGKFVRYDVGNATETAPGGGKAGMVVEQLKLLYGDALQSAPHKYVEGGKVFSVAAPDGAPGKLVFEADGVGKVTAWRVGLPPQVDYVEGCS